MEVIFPPSFYSKNAKGGGTKKIEGRKF